MSDWFWEKLKILAAGAALIVVFGLLILLGNLEVKDTDIWLHLAVGEHIVETHSIPKVDILSCSIAGRPWINHEWLFQLVIYLAYNLGGIDAWTNLQVFIITLTFIFLLFLGFNKDRLFSVAFLLLLVLLVYANRLLLRPEIFSLLFFTIYIYCLAFNLSKRSVLFILFTIQALWTNMHGFFILGPVLIGLNLFGEWAKRHLSLPWDWKDVGRLNDEEYRRLKQLLCVVLAACFLNPYFAKGVWYPFSVLFSSPQESKVFFDSILELAKPIIWGNLWDIREYSAYKILIIFSVLSFILNYKKIDIGLLVFWGIFLLFSLNAARNIVFFAIVAYLVTLINCQSFGFLLGPSKRIKQMGSIIASLALIFWTLSYVREVSLNGYFDFDKYERKSEFGGVSLRNFPYKAVNFLVENHVQGNFMNDFNSGAYLLGHTFPNIKVFIDGRTEVYGAEFFEKYRKIWEGDQKLFEEMDARLNFNGAFLNSVYAPAPAKFIQYLYHNPNWALVYFDYDAAIFLKNLPFNKVIIDRYRIDLSQWVAPKENLLKLGVKDVTPYRHINRGYALYNLKFIDKAKEEIEEALRVYPFYEKAYKLLGQIAIDEGKYDKALEYLRNAKLLDSGDVETRYYLGVVFENLGDLEQAKSQCDRVLANNPKNVKGLFLLSSIYAKEKKCERSVSVLERVVTFEPGKMEARFYEQAGECYQRMGQNNLAQQQFLKAVQLRKP